MTMPGELSVPVQRALRTMISGVMLVQCFTVYAYLAAYTVILYPVFLEERPTLLLPWLLLAAIRKLLCELTSLSLGLGICVLLGAARPACIKFLIVKAISITPAVYMWLLVLSYYYSLKMAVAFKTFPAVLPSSDDCGLELAVRRRRTKSLLGEEQLRRKILANFYGHGRSSSLSADFGITSKKTNPTRNINFIDNQPRDTDEVVSIKNLPESSHRSSNTDSYEDWAAIEFVVPRDTDRILEQFVRMSLCVSTFLTTEGVDGITSQNPEQPTDVYSRNTMTFFAMVNDSIDTPSNVGSERISSVAYLQDYPNIFMKKLSYDAANIWNRSSLTTDSSDYYSSVTSKNETHSESNHADKKVVSKLLDQVFGVKRSRDKEVIKNNLKTIVKKTKELKIPENTTTESFESIDVMSNNFENDFLIDFNEDSSNTDIDGGPTARVN